MIKMVQLNETRSSERFGDLVDGSVGDVSVLGRREILSVLANENYRTRDQI